MNKIFLLNLSIPILAHLFVIKAFALNVSVIVQYNKGKPLEDAVLYAKSMDVQALFARNKGRAVMDQRNKEFIPYVLPVQKGTWVYFPNSDNIRHHVYSFSKPKKFELPLYKGKSAPPVFFGTPGVVILGCNIHDWMLSYIYIIDSPFFSKTSAKGTAKIEGLEPGKYQLMVWHPRMKASPEDLMITENIQKNETFHFQLDLKPEWRRHRANTFQNYKY
jgi:plastocyanin